MLVTIFTAPAHGAGQTAQDSAELVAERGLQGDRYFGDGIVSIIESEEIDRFNAETGLNVPHAAIGRNLVTSGVRLNPLVGQQFRIGDAVLEGTELCEPCATLGKNLSTAAVTPAQVVRTFAHAAGIRARVVSGARIQPGDSVG